MTTTSASAATPSRPSRYKCLVRDDYDLCVRYNSLEAEPFPKVRVPAAKLVAVSESLESATAGAPTPAAEPEGATALGLDNLRIAVQAPRRSASTTSAPPPAPPSGWEDVG